tara:strand:- start:136 stop:423 length:288 start_codon:yes stop_codon:yes gene_type:complete
MFLLTVKDQKDDGAYAVNDRKGNKVLFLFEEEDDAERYAMQLHDQEDAVMEVIEVDGPLAIRTCKLYNYRYTVVKPSDIVIPPRLDDNVPENPLA